MDRQVKRGCNLPALACIKDSVAEHQLHWKPAQGQQTGRESPGHTTISVYGGYMTATLDLPTSVSPEQANAMTREGARILDVRTTGEYESVHIPGSYNVPLDLLSEHREELTSSVDDPVI